MSLTTFPQKLSGKVVKCSSAAGPLEASEDLLSYLHLSVVRDVVKGAVAHNLGND
ncbi:MAG: hypothetical protein RXO24_09735 [Acidilobus sp.]